MGEKEIMPIWIDFDELSPPPKNQFYYEGRWDSHALGNPKKGVSMEIFDIDVRGRSDILIVGDVPVRLNYVEKAREQLEQIDGCVLLTEHKHGKEKDLHPICLFSTKKDAKTQIKKIWKWANNWGEKDVK